MNEKTKFLSILLAVVMIFSQLTCVSVFADEIADDTDASVVTADFFDEEEETPTDTDPYAGCEFSSGYYYRFVGEDVIQIMGYTGQKTNLKIPQTLDGYTVTGIGAEAFKYSQLESVTIPDTVTTIGNYAFERSYYLYEINIGDNVKMIGHDAFTHTAFYYDLSNWEDGVLYLDNYLLTTYYTSYFEEEEDEEYLELSSSDNQSKGYFDDDYDVDEIYFEEPYLRVKDGTRVIADGAFNDAYYLDYIYLPESIVTVHSCVTWYVDHILYAGTQEQKDDILLIDYYLRVTTWHCNATDETMQKRVIKDATCTRRGTYELYCTVCGLSEEFTLPALDHVLGEKIKTIKPTCSHDGFDLYKCATCGMYMADNYTWCEGELELVEEIDAVCNDYAYEVYKCNICGETYKDPVDDSFKEHSKGELVETVEVTCLEDGYSIYKCDECGEAFKTDIVYARGTHSRGEFVTRVAPTCEEEGYTVYKCAVCGEEYHDSFIEAQDHPNLVYVRTVNPTCTSEGYDIYRCTKCKEEVQTNYVDASHTKGAYVRTVKPNCWDEGYDVFKCAVCGKEFETNYTYSDYDDHEPGQLVKTVLPTCTEPGYSVYKCARCGVEYESDYFFGEFYGHTKGETVKEIPKSCLHPSSVTYKCAVCDEEFTEYNYDESYIPHKFANGACTECGIKQEDCIESPHNYNNNMEEIYTITRPGADSLAITFSAYTYLEDYCDYIIIVDKSDNLVGIYTGYDLAGETIKVNGNTAKIILITDESECYYGFSTTKIEAITAPKPTEPTTPVVPTKPTTPSTSVTPPAQTPTTTVSVKPKIPTLKVVTGKKQFKIKYKKVSGATGFQVRYRIKGKWKVKTFNTKKSAVKTIKGLKKGTYQVQIRSFSKGKVYSKWSKVKKFKVK